MNLHDNIERVTESGCWIWLGSTNGKQGYGVVYFNRRMQLAHRLSYELHKGPIAQGLQIDHLCRVRLCVNPNHLEPVSARTNLVRGNGFAGLNARKTHCKYGHDLMNARTQKHFKAGTPVRICRACRSIWNRQQYLKRVANQ